jgi:hypothetical protein
MIQMIQMIYRSARLRYAAMPLLSPNGSGKTEGRAKEERRKKKGSEKAVKR